MLLWLSLVALSAAAPASSPLVNATDCLFRSFFLERAQAVSPALTPAQLSAMADALSGDPLMGSGCRVAAPPARPPAPPRRHAPGPGPEVFADAARGSDAGAGTLADPFLTLGRALAAVRAAGGGAGGGTISLRGGGTFHLPATLLLTPADSGLTIQTYPGDASRAWLSGAQPLPGLAWRPINVSGGANVYAASLGAQGVGGVASLRLGGGRLIRARYPNVDPETGQPFGRRGASIAAEFWPPIPHPMAAAYWTAPNVSRPDSTFSTYTMAINGTSCARYSPPISHFCGGSGVVAGGVVLSAQRLPHQPYADPRGAVITALHGGSWCTFAYQVGDYAFDAANGTGLFSFAQGGQQCGRPEASHGALYIENVAEELDAPGEFYYAPATQTLLLWHNASAGTPPPSDGSLAVPVLQQLLAAGGTQAQPVRDLRLLNLGFRDTAPATFAPHTAPSGSDYAINRAAALSFTGVAGLLVSGCSFERLDNSAIFVGGYARGVEVSDSEFAWLGESGIVTLGDTDGAPIAGWGPDGSAGNQPQGTRVLRNFAHELGIINKQSCFFFQAVSRNATVAGNVVFNGARHGIQYNDGLGEGSLQANNVMFNLNRETSDTGLFNNWDRLTFLPRKDAQHVDRHIGNLGLVNYNTADAFDTDDGSSYELMANNVQLYGSVLKSDFSGHDITFSDHLSVWGGASDQYQPLIPGYINYMHGGTLLAQSDGEALFQHVCPNASDWPSVTDLPVYSPTGAITVCGRSVAAWQADIPGVLRNVSAAAWPATLTAQGILDMARATLQAAQSRLAGEGLGAE